MIKRSKIVLDIFRTEFNNNNMHRVSELISYNSFVIAEEGKDYDINERFKNIIILSNYSNYVDTCVKYIKKDNEFRNNYCKNSKKLFNRRFNLKNILNQKLF